MDLSDSIFEIIFFCSLIKSAGQRFKVTPGQAPVSAETFVANLDLNRFFIPFFIILKGQESADIDKSIFFRTHGAAVGIRKHFPGNLPYGLVFISFIPVLDKITVFSEACGIDKERTLVFPGQHGCCLHIIHRYRLATVAVAGSGHDNQRYLRSFTLF